MLSREENDRLTQTGSSTPAGAYFRRYWLPALLLSEVPAPDSPPVRVRLLSEDLIAFRDTDGRVGLVEECQPKGYKQVSISGRELRDKLRAGLLPDPRIMRPETAQVLIERMRA